MSGVVAALAGPRLAAELRPTPARWRLAVAIGVAVAVAVGADLALQLGQFMAPLAFLFAQAQACTWRRTARSLALAAATAVFAITIGGVLVQLPWLLIPAVFATTSAVLYALPPLRYVTEDLAILPTLLATLYIGVLHPDRMASTGGAMALSYAIGLLTATLLRRVVLAEPPLQALAADLAVSLRDSRARLRAALAHYLAGGGGAPADIVALSGLAAHLQHLDHARDDGLSAADERVVVLFLTVTERVATSVDLVTGLAAQNSGDAYARLIGAEVEQMGAVLDRDLDAFASAAERLTATPTRIASAPSAWPDPHAALAALEARQLAMRHAGAFATVSVAEAERSNALVDALRQLAGALRRSPAALVELAAADAVVLPHALPATAEERSARLHFSLKVGLATTLALLIPITAHVDTLINLVVAPYLVAQLSLGGTIEKAPLRIAGVAIGGILAVLTMLTVMVNAGDVTVWLLWLGVLSGACGYLMAGGPRVAYVASQVAVTLFIVLIGVRPIDNVELTLWRLLGNFVGVSLLVAVFRLVAPDYAGRQLVARLRALLRHVLDVLPRADAAQPAAAQIDALQSLVAAHTAEALRLINEARFEGGGSGIGLEAAIDVVGSAERVAYRVAALARARRAAALAHLPLSTAAAFSALNAALHTQLGLTIEVLAARDHTARPGSLADRRAAAACAAAVARPRPDLAAAEAALRSQLDAARQHELDNWSPALTGALFAEAEHLRRLAEVLPALDRNVIRLCLPQDRDASTTAAPDAGAHSPA